MAKFKVTLTRIDEYEIEVDESLWTPEEISKWEDTFFPTEDTEEFAKHLAYAIMNNGSANGFMEGFGYVKTYAGNGIVKPQHNQDLKRLKDEDYTKGISVKILSENDDFEDDITRLD